MTEEKTRLINQMNITNIHFAWDNYNEKGIVDKFKEYAKHTTHKPHGGYASVYVLVNFDTTIEQDLERVYTLRELGYDPYVMVYNKPKAPQKTTQLQRWVNNKIIFKTCERFEDYKPI